MNVAGNAIEADRLDILGHIRSGDWVVCGQACAEPLSLTTRLVQACEQTGLSVKIFLGTGFSDTFQPVPRTMRLASYGAIGRTAQAADQGLLDVMPVRYSQLPALFRNGPLCPDVVLLQARLGDDGRLSWGLACDYVWQAARRARTIIVELNQHVPFTHGASWPGDLRVDAWVYADRPPLELDQAPPDPVAQAIAKHVATLIPDGATLQTGVGSLPDATLSALSTHRHLGLHTGVLGDAAARLVTAGVIDNSRKPTDAGISVTNTLCGTRGTYALSHDNRAIEVRHIDDTHDAGVLNRLSALHAINGALEVDLGGQVNSEEIDGRLRGGIGGLLDFAQAARRSAGGRSIIVLPATAAGGRVSRIVADLSGPATIGRADADIVVTEYGIADLRNVSLNERARRMAGIAAPQFRAFLEQAWRKNRLH